MDKTLLESTVHKVLDELRNRPIPLGVSNRHIHLCAADYARLFPEQAIREKKRCCNRDNTRQNRPSRWLALKVS